MKDNGEVRKLKESFDLRGYLEDRGIRYWTEGDNVGADWIGIKCRYCNDHANHLGFNVRTMQMSCFKCGQTGDILTFIMDQEGLEFSDALHVLEAFQRPGVRQKPERKKVERQDYTVLPKEHVPLISSDLPRVVHGYLRRRRLPTSLVDEWRLGYCAYGREAFRIIAPVYLDGRLVSWVGVDATGEARVKYKDCPQERAIIMNKHLVYGADEAFQERQLIIVEGVVDKWRMGRAAVSLFGKKATREQLALLARKVPKGRQVKVLLDADAYAEGERLANNLAALFDRVRLILLDEGDPAELSDQGVREVLEA